MTKLKSGWYMVPKGSPYHLFVEENKYKNNAFELKLDNFLTEDFYFKPSFHKIEEYACGTKALRMLRTDIIFPASHIRAVKRKPVSKEIKVQATKNSLWRVKEAGLFIVETVEKDAFNWDVHDYKIIDIPIGTEFRLTEKKGYMGPPSSGMMTNLEKYVRHDNPDYFPISFGSLVHMECIESGENYRYWKLMDKNGNSISKKRFKEASHAKGSARVHLGKVKDEDNGQYWLETERPLTFDNWKIVQYDENDNAISEESLTEWYKAL